MSFQGSAISAQYLTYYQSFVREKFKENTHIFLDNANKMSGRFYAEKALLSSLNHPKLLGFGVKLLVLRGRFSARESAMAIVAGSLDTASKFKFCYLPCQGLNSSLKTTWHKLPPQ